MVIVRVAQQVRAFHLKAGSLDKRQGFRHIETMQAGVVLVGVTVVVDHAEHPAGLQQGLHRRQQFRNVLVASEIVAVVQVQRGKRGIQRAGLKAGVILIAVEADHVRQTVVREPGRNGLVVGAVIEAQEHGRVLGINSAFRPHGH